MRSRPCSWPPVIVMASHVSSMHSAGSKPSRRNITNAPARCCLLEWVVFGHPRSPFGVGSGYPRNRPHGVVSVFVFLVFHRDKPCLFGSSNSANGGNPSVLCRAQVTAVDCVADLQSYRVSRFRAMYLCERLEEFPIVLVTSVTWQRLLFSGVVRSVSLN